MDVCVFGQFVDAVVRKCPTSSSGAPTQAPRSGLTYWFNAGRNRSKCFLATCVALCFEGYGPRSAFAASG